MPTANNSANVTPVLRSKSPRNEERGQRRHSGRSVSLIGEEGEKERGVYYVTRHFSFSPQHGQLLLQPFCLSFSCEQHTYDDDSATSNTTANGTVH